MTEQERDKAFRAAAAAGVKGRTALLRNTRDEIVRLLKLAIQQIALVLAGQPSDYQVWRLPLLQKEIERILATFGEQGSAVISTAAGAAWQAGIDLVDKPLEAGGFSIGATLGTPDTDQLMAMRHFMTGRIANISTVSADAINSELGLVVIGAQSPGDAITAVNRILGGNAARRATTIVRTELGRVFSAASYARMQQAVANGANIRKKWIKSGKVHSRPGHDAIHGEIKKVDEPFWVMGKDGVMHELMFPHDPKAPAAETINCGCVATPEAPDWKSMVGKADGTPYTNAELRARAAARHPGGPGMQARVQEAFDPNQPRDEKGRWTDGGYVAELTGDELGHHATTKELRKAAMAWAETHLIGKSFVNANSGHEIKVTRQGMKHSLSGKNNPEVKASVALPSILAKADYAGPKAPTDKHLKRGVIAMHRYIAKVKLGKETFHVGIVTHEKGGGHEHYDHAIVTKGVSGAERLGRIL